MSVRYAPVRGFRARALVLVLPILVISALFAGTSATQFAGAGAMEPLTLVMVLVVNNCASWDPYELYDESVATLIYLNDHYKVLAKDFRVYCVELDELYVGKDAPIHVRSWTDTPNSIMIYMFKEGHDHETFLKVEDLHEKTSPDGVGGYAYEDMQEIRGYGDNTPYDSCEWHRGNTHGCNVQKIQVRMKNPTYWLGKEALTPDEWLDDPTKYAELHIVDTYEEAERYATRANIVVLSHEVSHAILMRLDYPEKIYGDWVHEVSNVIDWEILHMPNGNRYPVLVPYPVHKSPPSPDGGYVWYYEPKQ